MAPEAQVRRILPRQQLSVDVYTLACERTAAIMDRFDRCFVSFSGGKDSTATLNVALDVAHSDPRYARHLPLRAVFFDEEAIPYETEQYVRLMGDRDDVALDWMCLPVQHRNACSRKHPYWWPWAPEAEDRWCRPLPPEAIQTWPGFTIWPDKARLTIPDSNGLLADPADGNTAMLMGIRASESLTRNQAVSQKQIDNYVIKYTGATDRGCLWKAYPVYDWTDTDVWTAPAIKKWAYNCNVYEAPIWMSDFSFKLIGEIRPGDEIIGWEPQAGRRAAQGTLREMLTPATVLATHKRYAEVVKVTMESGRVIRCTANHLWMHHKCRSGHNDVRNPFAPPELGHNLSHIIDVPDGGPLADTRTAAWLGGMYDGEGCGDRIYQSGEHNPDVYAAIGQALNKLDIPYVELNGRSVAQRGYRITGGRAGLVRFLNIAQPVRRTGRQVTERVFGGRFRTPDAIVSIEPDGEADVYALTTTTGNYVCWGYASKNSAYDRQEMAGRTIHQQRCSPAFGEEPLQQLHTWASCFPEVWEKMVDRVPGAAAAARYALTELYGFSQRPEKPPGVLWPDFIVRYLGKHPPDIAAQVADRIKDKIRRHYHQCALPILPDTPCPETGLSWNWLLGIAMRGDFKGRKHEKHRIVLEADGTRPVTAWRRYLAELETLTAAGTTAEIAYPYRLPADLASLLPDYAREASA